MNQHTSTGSTDAGCEPCGSKRAREVYKAADRLGLSDRMFAVVQCLECGVLRTLPTMSQTELEAFYPEEYWGQDEPSGDWIRSSQSEKSTFLERCGLRGGRLLDVGCGSGFFLRALGSERWDRYGVETDENASARVARALGESRVFAGTLAEARFPDRFFDVVTFWSALEHSNEPRATMIEAARVMRPGASLIVQVPNSGSYQARWFGGDWFPLDVPRHRYHFDSGTLGRLLSTTGFELYRSTFYSKAHNAHALKQSLKRRLLSEEGHRLKSGLYYLSAPFMRPFDLLMTTLSEGATLTAAARRS